MNSAPENLPEMCLSSFDSRHVLDMIRATRAAAEDIYREYGGLRPDGQPSPASVMIAEQARRLQIERSRVLKDEGLTARELAVLIDSMTETVAAQQREEAASADYQRRLAECRQKIDQLRHQETLAAEERERQITALLQTIEAINDDCDGYPRVEPTIMPEGTNKQEIPAILARLEAINRALDNGEKLEADPVELPSSDLEDVPVHPVFVPDEPFSDLAV